MITALQDVVVALLVISAALYAAWALLPAARLLRVLIALDRAAQTRQWLAGSRRLVIEPMLRRTAAKSAGSCGDCAAHKPGSPPR
ncbi:MAG: hypothetical protein KDI32_06290 [Pseudomonadales bacterium]|nr:hypothetical protein [Pseudomonadales bacterium]